MSRLVLVASLALSLLASDARAYDWGKPRAPVIPQADGFFNIPGAAVVPQKTQIFKAIYNATRAADKPDQLVPAINMAGSELNLIAGVGVPVTNAKFVIVFHDGGMSGILKDASYRAKFGVPNPNLAALAQMRRQGVELYVCGQNLAFEGIDPATITPDVRVASDALIVLMTYQAKGYALLSY